MIELLWLLFVAAPRDIIELPNDEEEVLLKTMGRKGRASSRRTAVSQEPKSTLALEAVVL